MDDTEEEKVQLLESLRLQDAVLSTAVDSSVNVLESDSDSDANESVGESASGTAGTAELEPSFNPVKHVISDGETGRVSSESKEKNRSPRRDAASAEPSWADALEANQEYDTVLAQLETEIKLNLAKVTKQLDEVQCKIGSVGGKGSAANLKSHWLYVFGMPYFKTHNFYPCPFNEDYHSKKRNNEICWSVLPTFHQWTTRHKKILNFAVRKLSLEKCLSDANLKRAVMRKDLASAQLEGNNDKAAALEEEIAAFDVDDEAQAMVNNVIANGEHDWLQISAKYLEGKQSAESCRSFWYLYLHPSINKSPYSEEEERKLTSLAEKYRHQDWDNIAKELGTNRSGYQCFIIYQNKLNASIKRNVWDASEDQKLLRVVEQCRLGDFIPWGKVAYHMDGRTKTQVFNRWSYSVNPAIRKGRFTPEEDIMILAGVQMWGEDFQRISNFLRDRTTCQVRDRYKHYLNRPGLGLPWTIQDDELLLKLAERHGKNWAKIAQRFPSKDRTQVRHRYSTLARWRVKNPKAPLSEAPSRCYNPQQYRDFQDQWDKARSILNCGTVEEMVQAKHSLVTSLLKKRKNAQDSLKRRKPSPIETDLINYFRCSYDLPGARKKLQLKSGDAQKYAEELGFFLSLLKSNLNLPSIAEIQADSSLSSADKEILKAYLTSKTTQAFLPDFEYSEVEDGQFLCNKMDTAHVPIFCDPPPTISEPSTSIDYTPTHDLASLYINLPLMNFDKDEVVADKNQDPMFFEPPIMEPFIPEAVPEKPKAEKAYMCPPNLTTLVGLRTFLLNRRNLLTWSNENLQAEVVYDDDKLAEAKQKFDQRIMFLFLWPALMSRHAPSSNCSIFSEDDDNNALVENTSSNSFDTEESQNYVPMAKVSLAAECDGIPSSSLAIPSTSGSHAVPSTSKPSKVRRPSKIRQPPKKRLKIASGKEDIDPDDPDDPSSM